MNIDIIKSQIITDAKKYLVIVVGLSALLAGAVYFESSLNEKFAASNTKLMEITASINKKNLEYKETTKNLEEYTDIPDYKLPTAEGYALGRDRLRAAAVITQKLKVDYMFKKLLLSISEIKPMPSFASGQYSVFQGSFTMSLSAPTDEYIFSFINDVKNAFPGFLSVKKLELKKLKQIDAANMNTFFSPNSSEGFVSGEIELEWLTMQDKNPAASPEIPNMLRETNLPTEAVQPNR